jgi:hypothetical protein
MRIAVISLMLVSTAALAEPDVQQYDPARFEQRFKDADLDGNGRLSREEAYAAFPRMPEFFDEIDSNQDSAITLSEVEQAMERRVNAAMGSTGRYDALASGTGETANKNAATVQGQALPSEMDAKRLYRQQYYESISGEKALSSELGEPGSKSPSSPLFDKRY